LEPIETFRNTGFFSKKWGRLKNIKYQMNVMLSEVETSVRQAKRLFDKLRMTSK
jgi:hypothetical protein